MYQIRVIPSDAPVQAQLDRYAGRGWHWIVLVDDHSHHSAWQARLLASRERIVDKLGINGIAQELRDAFIQSIAHANTRITRPEWFCSRPSERNPLASTMFQDTCRAEAILRKASDLERIVVVTDAPGVGLALSEVRAPEYQIVIAFPVTNGPSRVQCLKQFAAFLLGAAIKRFQAPPISKHPPDVLIHSHAGATAVSSASVSDQVFPGLALNLTAQGKTVWTMKYLPASRHLRKYWRKMLRDDTQPFCEYSLYHLSDFVYVWHAANRMRTLEIELQPADRIPLSRLARQELHTSAFDPGVLEALLRTRLGRRLREREIMPATVIMEFENMILERGLIYGFRKDLPRTKLIGYQHSTLNPMLLCNFMTLREINTGPAPDRVVCTGERFRNLLVSAGWPSNRVVVGPALRYSSETLIDRNPHDNPPPYDVFVPLPLLLSDASELLEKLVAAIGDDKRFRVRLRSHPFTSLSAVLGYAGVRIANNFVETDASIAQECTTAHVVVGSGTSGLVEAAALSVPVVSVHRETSLDFDTLAYFPELGAAATSPDEIREAILSTSSTEFRPTGGRNVIFSDVPVSDTSAFLLTESTARN